MNGETKNLILPWQGINIKITYNPNFSKAFNEVQGYPLAYIKIKSDERLPISDTGFSRAFIPDHKIKESGGVIAYVRKELDEAAKTKEWKTYAATKNQLSLF